VGSATNPLGVGPGEACPIREAEHLHERTLPNLFDAAIGLRLRNASYRSNVKQYESEEISNQVATNDLRALVELGLLQKHGAKRGTYYTGTDDLREIVTKIRADRKPIDASSLFAIRGRPLRLRSPSRRLAALLGRHPRRPRLPALLATLAPERNRRGVLALVGVRRRLVTGRLVRDRLRQLVQVGGVA
jgi:hypothetical protein